LLPQGNAHEDAALRLHASALRRNAPSQATQPS
jgi:hypothetical protein